MRWYVTVPSGISLRQGRPAGQMIARIRRGRGPSCGWPGLGFAHHAAEMAVQGIPE